MMAGGARGAKNSQVFVEAEKKWMTFTPDATGCYHVQSVLDDYKAQLARVRPRQLRATFRCGLSREQAREESGRSNIGRRSRRPGMLFRRLLGRWRASGQSVRLRPAPSDGLGAASSPWATNAGLASGAAVATGVSPFAELDADLAARPDEIVGTPGRRGQRFALDQRSRGQRIDRGGTGAGAAEQLIGPDRGRHQGHDRSGERARRGLSRFDVGIGRSGLGGECDRRRTVPPARA